MTSRFVQKTFLTAEEELQIRRTYNHAQPNSWFGTWPAGSALTAEQLNGLAKRGLDTDTQRVEVHVSTSQAQWNAGLKARQPWRLVPCPIVSHEKDGRLRVIAPSGEQKLVWPTGDIRKPWRWPGEKDGKVARANSGGVPV